MPIPQSKAKHSIVRLDMDLFDPALLQDEIALENALCIFESHLQNATVSQEALLRALTAKPHLFEFIFSVVKDDVAELAVDKILSLFPTTAVAFESSFAGSLLRQLLQYFWILGIQMEKLKDYQNSMDLARATLKELATVICEPEARSLVAEKVSTEAERKLVTKRSNQKEWKQAKRATRAEVPDSRRAAEALENELLNGQKRVLKGCLEVLRIPEHAALYKTSYIMVNDTPTVATAGKIATSGGSTHTNDFTETKIAAASVPSALPRILPIKAAFHFDSVEGFGDWPILISTRADKNLRVAQKSDKNQFRIILKKIKDLSNGHFSGDNQKPLTKPGNRIPIYEAKMTRDSRLVYRIDCIKDFETDVEKQVIFVYGVYTHAQLDSRFWNAVSHHLGDSVQDKEYRAKCVYRSKPMSAGDKVFSPATFPPESDVPSPITIATRPELGVEDVRELHSIINLEKFVTFSRALLNSIITDQDVAHVFNMSPEEQEIVKYTGSCFVLGRSGTGKTTTMLFKMLAIEKACWVLREEYQQDLSRPRQLFVTQSRLLAQKVEQYYAKLAASWTAGQMTTEEAIQITHAAASEQKAAEDRRLVDLDEEEAWHRTLPKSFSELRDEHFPLFVTFDQLCRLLEGDLMKSTDNEDETHDSSVNGRILHHHASFVSYKTFVHEYWPHLPQSLTKRLDPALIFAEFMGVIRGSELSLETKTGYLDKAQYLSVSHRQQGTFASCREAVYALFEAYLKKKREKRQWDAADRTHSILDGLRSLDIRGNKLDFVYVDEAQDNLLVDALILRRICKNPEGLFWAGDTAQTISASSSFRFNDLKAFLYRVESSNSTGSLKHQQSFQLTNNYRSHGGIVDCAHSLVQLITNFWPNAIDVLTEERSLVGGLMPIFFTGWNQNSVHYEQVLFGTSVEEIEFGAQQCILVRDDDARQRLERQVGDIGSVLTIYESKGLEFNDVLLYNFFEDSTVDVSQWRVILNALPPGHDRDRCPSFDETRHNGVCRELKFLYVAMTRARQNLWIADCSAKGEPLRTYWNSKNLVDNVSAIDNMPRLATKSTPEEWAAAARAFFDHKCFSQAARSYKCAGMPRERDVAQAYFLRECAASKLESHSTVNNPRKSAFSETALAFAACASSANLPSDRSAYYRISAECHKEAGELTKAAKAYILAEEYTLGAQQFREAGEFDDAIDTVEKYRAQIEPSKADKIMEVARLHYFRQQDLHRATRLFLDLEEALQFMDDYGFNSSRYRLLEYHGRLAEAAEIHLQEGRTAQAIRLFMKDATESSHQRAEASLLYGLWQHISFGTYIIGPEGDIERSYVEELLALSEELESRISLTARTMDEIAMFEAVATGVSSRLRALAKVFLDSHSDPIAATLSLDYAFSKSPRIPDSTGDQVIDILQSFYTYTREMQRLFANSEADHSSFIQKLFGVIPASDSQNLFKIRRGTFLHTAMRNLKTGKSPAVPAKGIDGYMATRWEVANVLPKVLREWLRHKTDLENLDCLAAEAFRPCPAAVVLGNCYSKDGCGYGHDLALVTRDGFHLRIRMILTQILIYHTTYALEDQPNVAMQRRAWLSRLYQAYYPVHGMLGSFIDLDITLIPEAERGLQVVNEWIRDFFFTASFYKQSSMTTLSAIAEVATLALMINKGGASAYFGRAQCVTKEKPEKLLRSGGRYVVHDLLHFLCRGGDTALSAGVLFIKAVFEHRLDMDANVLCQMVEQICAAYIVAHKLQVGKSLHDLTLSHKWVIRLHAAEALKTQKRDLLRSFIDLIPKLLWGMYTGYSFLRHNGNSSIDRQVRNIFVSRICKNFILLGYNIPDATLKDIIRVKITSLKQRDRRLDTRFSQLFQRYIHAESWTDLVKALRSTGVKERGTSEELIHLRESVKVTGQPHEIRGTRSIVYKRVTDIPTLLRGAGKNVLVSDPRRNAPSFAPACILQRKVESTGHDVVDAADERELGLSIPPNEENSGVDHDVDLEAAARAVDEGREEQVAIPPSAKEIAAAAFLARAYRRRLSRRKGEPKKGREAERNRWFLAFRDSPMVQNFTRRHYVHLYLGPLPLVLVCLDVMSEQLLASRKKAGDLMSSVEHSQYENVMTQIKTAISLNKRIQAVKQQLTPNSEFHHRQSLAELQQLVVEVSNIAAALPRGVIQGIEWDLTTAVKVIVQESKPRRPSEKKPTLVVDIDDFEYYE